MALSPLPFRKAPRPDSRCRCVDPPARRALGWAFLAPYRRTLGLAAFGYCALHLLIYALVDLWGAFFNDPATAVIYTY